MEVAFTAGSTNFTLRETGIDGAVRIGAESPSYPRHDAMLAVAGNGGNPLITVQLAPGAHVVVVAAGSGQTLYNSEASDSA